jgi:hypothetical protein
MTGLTPIQTSAGNEISVPPPAIELIAPAASAASAMTMSWRSGSVRRFRP